MITNCGTRNCKSISYFMKKTLHSMKIFTVTYLFLNTFYFQRPGSRMGGQRPLSRMGASKTSMGKKQYGSRLLKPAKPLLNGQPGKNSKLGSTANQVAPVADIPEVQIEVIVHSFLIQNHSISIKNKFKIRRG